MKSIDITIQDKEGLHARPAGILSKAAKGFESKVTMTKNGKVADMKKIFAVMGLAVKCGETVTIAADGPDEAAVIWNSAHRCTFFQAALLAGQGQFQFTGSNQRIIKKQLIKVTETEK